MTIIARYVIRQYLKLFSLCITAAAGLFLVIDFFERISNLAGYEPSPWAVAAYFLLKLPGMISEIYPAATLLAVLISIGLLARHREILALRASGISTWQLAWPLVLTASVVSGAIFLWNETVVPPAASHSRYINDVVIKKKPDRGLFNASSLWFQSQKGFFNIDYFDANRNALYGLTVYEADGRFRLNRIIEIPEARWREDHWELGQGTVKSFGPGGEIVARPLNPGEFELVETPADFLRRRRKSKEFSYRQLKARIDLLEAKGLDADRFRVDLHVKLAWPLSGIVTVLMGFPLAVRGGRRAGLTSNIGIGMVIGFAYWVTMGVAVSAGRTGGIPPLLAAWAANGLFSLLGGVLYLGRW